VQAEAPGFEAGDFDIELEDSRLILRASKKAEVKKEREKEGYREVSERECYKAATLPSGIDKDKVEASYHNGVLTVRLPKTAAAKAKHIPIKGA